MKRLYILNITTILIFLHISGVYGGGSEKFKENLGVGFNAGGHRIYGDSYTKSDIGLAAEGLVNYTFRQNKFGIITGLGFGWIKGTMETQNFSQSFSTSLLTFDVKAAFWPFLGKPFNPYAFLGLGAFNFSYPLEPTKRYFDFSFILGAAIASLTGLSYAELSSIFPKEQLNMFMLRSHVNVKSWLF